MKEQHYFINSLGSAGYHSFSASAFNGIDVLIKLPDQPASVLELVFKELMLCAKKNDISVHILHNCLDNSLEGMIFPERSSAVMNIAPYEKDGDDAVTAIMKEHLESAGAYFKKAKNVHDKLEKIYKDNTDFQALNAYTDELCSEMLSDIRLNKNAAVAHRFFHAPLESGDADYVPNLTRDMKTRYLIHGKPGNGKSTFMKKIAEKAIRNGFDTEIYHCAFDPFSVDMVIIPELEFSVFDNTDPHAYKPENDRDRILDFCTEFVEPDTDEKYRLLIEEYQSSYNEWCLVARKEIASINKIRTERQRDKTDKFCEADQLIKALKIKDHSKILWDYPTAFIPRSA